MAAAGTERDDEALMDPRDFQDFIRTTLAFAGHDAWLPSHDSLAGEWVFVHHRDSGERIVLGRECHPIVCDATGQPAPWDDERRRVATILSDLMDPESWRARMWASVGCLPTEEMLLAFVERQRFSIAIAEADGRAMVTSAVADADGTVRSGHSFTGPDRLEAIATVIKRNYHLEPLVRSHDAPIDTTA
jgi:hypothetical protein